MPFDVFFEKRETLTFVPVVKLAFEIGMIL